MSRAGKIARAIDKYGTNITLKFKPVANDATAPYDDWPDPVDPPTTPAPADATVKAIIVPVPDIEYNEVSETGVLPEEMVQGFFKSDQDLNEVEFIVWQTNTYRTLRQDAYELSGGILVQEVLLVRVRSEVLYPHA